MKTTKVLSLAVLMAAMTGMSGITFSDAFAAPGNGAGGVGSGGYQLNLIGMDKNDKLGDNDDNNGHRIFVNINGHSTIKLSVGPFEVIDADATDSDGGEFQLPYPGDCDTVDFDQCNLAYSVHMRVLGKPLPNAEKYGIVTCAEEKSADLNNDGVLDAVCSEETVSLSSANGKGKNSKFTNVSKELLTLCIDTDVTVDSGSDNIIDNDCDLRAELFDDKLMNFTWEVDANGHRLAQLRFIDNQN